MLTSNNGKLDTRAHYESVQDHRRKRIFCLDPRLFISNGHISQSLDIIHFYDAPYLALHLRSICWLVNKRLSNVLPSYCSNCSTSHRSHLTVTLKWSTHTLTRLP